MRIPRLEDGAADPLARGIGSIPLARLVSAIAGLLQSTVPGTFTIAATPVPLSEVEQAWPKDDSARRTVFIVDRQQS